MIKSLIVAWIIACFALPVAGADAAQPGAETPRQVLVLLNMPPPHFRPDSNYSGGYAETAGRAARRRIASALARSYGLQMVTDWPMPALGLDCYVMDVPAPMQPSDVASRLTSEPGVAWAQVMNIFQPLGRDDVAVGRPSASRQWPLAELHQSVTGRGVRIAVIDSSIQADHPGLSEQVATRLNLVADRPDTAELHGTAVAGVIAARSDSRIGIVGVAPLARILALRACWQAADTLCTSLSLALALSAALENNADIINLSLGGPPDRLIQRLIEAALARGIPVVAAMNRAVANGGFPAALPGVISVADAPSTRSPGAVAAPGTDVLTTLPGSRWGVVSGSSYAAAHVSGLVALIIDARSRNTAMSGRHHAPMATDLVADPDGRIDACATLARALVACGCSCSSARRSVDSIARH
ncbi:MAG TPA: S8 family serine peptidase [Ramlibacter sp.]|nr:S8 family serine peptidase [Ramlibacter sp.]